MVPRPRVSVVIPAFNAESYLGAAISSVLTQNYPEVETIVVDDGSSDATEDIARGYGPRIRYHRQSNSGCAAARNAGIQIATGDYIALCDADDMLLPHHVERAMEVIEASPPGPGSAPTRWRCRVRASSDASFPTVPLRRRRSAPRSCRQTSSRCSLSSPVAWSRRWARSART